MKKAKETETEKPIDIQIRGLEAVRGVEGLNVNPNIPTHHADMINVLFSSEGLALISFFSRTPGLNVEECRISFTHVLAKKIVDLFCRHLNYYPENPSQQKGRK
jgi:hypothetical protein